MPSALHMASRTSGRMLTAFSKNTCTRNPTLCRAPAMMGTAKKCRESTSVMPRIPLSMLYRVSCWRGDPAIVTVSVPLGSAAASRMSASQRSLTKSHTSRAICRKAVRCSALAWRSHLTSTRLARNGFLSANHAVTRRSVSLLMTSNDSKAQRSVPTPENRDNRATFLVEFLTASVDREETST